MEPEVRERFERIEATLALTATNHRIAMEEFQKSMAASEKRMQASDHRMDRFEKRHGTFEKGQEAYEKNQRANDKKQQAFETNVRKLIVEGMRIVNHLAAENRKARADTNALRAEMREFKGELRAYIKAQGNGHKGPNGNGRR